MPTGRKGGDGHAAQTGGNTCDTAFDGIAGVGDTDGVVGQSQLYPGDLRMSGKRLSPQSMPGVPGGAGLRSDDVCHGNGGGGSGSHGAFCDLAAAVADKKAVFGSDTGGFAHKAAVLIKTLL